MEDNKEADLNAVKQTLSARPEFATGGILNTVSDKRFKELAHSAGWTMNEVEEGLRTLARINGCIVLSGGQPESRLKPHAETIRQMARSVGWEEETGELDAKQPRHTTAHNRAHHS